MVKRADLEFKHFVTDHTGLIFASARDSGNRIYNFILNKDTGNILEQFYGKFEVIDGEWAEYVKTSIQQYRDIVPTYRIPHFQVS